MAKLTFRQEAINDLSSIWEYTTAVWSEDQANKYYSMIKSACKEIVDGMENSRRYNEINEGLYGFRVGEHIIFYHNVASDEIEVIRILHERMDLKSKYLK